MASQQQQGFRLIMDWEHIIPSIDRVLLVSWLLKDFGWMSTNIYLGWPFGVTAIVYHTLALIFDPRRAFRFYNASFLLWVIGNFIWLTLEYCNEPLSSDVHWGPDIPVAPMNEQTIYILSVIKLLLFLSSLFIQCIMYIGIYYKKIEMPRNFDEEIVSVNQLARLLGRKDVSNTGSMTSRLKINDTGQYSNLHHLTITNALYMNEEQAALPISTAFVEYTYIIFWILKDLFWSISTGDLTINSLDITITCEIIALFFGAIAFVVYCISAYIYRRSLLTLLDSITTLLWISANFVWMSGEFFLRYQNMKFDDFDQGDDSPTRIVSTILFLLGIFIQIGIILYLSSYKCYKRKQRVKLVPSMESISFHVKKKKKASSSSSSFSKILYMNTTPQNPNHNNSSNNSIINNHHSSSNNNSNNSGNNHNNSRNMSYSNLPPPTSSSSSSSLNSGHNAREKMMMMRSIDIDYNYNDNDEMLLMSEGHNNSSSNNNSSNNYNSSSNSNHNTSNHSNTTTNNNDNSIGLHQRSVFGISGNTNIHDDDDDDDVEDEVMVLF